MDMNMLRVYDSIYRLGLTEKEYQDIEAEQKQTNHTGIYIAAVKKEKSICVSHDEKHKIVIKDIQHNKSPPPAPSRIILKTLVTFSNVPEQIFTLHKITRYRWFDEEIRFTAATIEEFKDRICDRFTNKHPKTLGNCNYPYYCKSSKEDFAAFMRKQIEEQLKALFWVFDEPFINPETATVRINIPEIIKVFTRKNRRMALIKTHKQYTERRGGGMFGCTYNEDFNETDYQIITFTPKDPRYNYTCPFRELYLGCSSEAEIWLDDSLAGKVSEKELKILSKRDPETDWFLLTPDEYNNSKSGIRMELFSAQRAEQASAAKAKYAENIKKAFAKGKVTKNGMTFTPESVSYEGMVFKGEQIGEYLESQNILIQEEPDFVSIFEGYIDYVLQPKISYNCYCDPVLAGYGFTSKTRIKVNEIDILLKKSGNVFRVNGCQINKADLAETLKQAIQYQSIAAYNKLLSHTSSVNLTVQDALENGVLEFELELDRNSHDNCLTHNMRIDRMKLALPLSRRKNSLYVTINSKEFKVKNSGALFDLGKRVDCYRARSIHGGLLNRTIKFLYRAIAGITPQDIARLVVQGKREYRRYCKMIEAQRKQAIENSLRFIEHAIKLTNARKTHKGYFVTGQSGTKYFVNTENLGVYKVKDGKQDQYLCIVDVHMEDGQAGKNDAVARRLLMLAKDEVVAKEIYDRGDKMDAHWLEIQKNSGVAA
jgi:hypothetical protein